MILWVVDSTWFLLAYESLFWLLDPHLTWRSLIWVQRMGYIWGRAIQWPIYPTGIIIEETLVFYSIEMLSRMFLLCIDNMLWYTMKNLLVKKLKTSISQMVDLTHLGTVLNHLIDHLVWCIDMCLWVAMKTVWKALPGTHCKRKQISIRV